ncbi:MAG: type II toxin-antitoxin system HicA family toxin [Planctomycetota bacterium]
MGGNSPIPFRKVKRAFSRGGAEHINTNGSHFVWVYLEQEVVIVVHKNQVKSYYINDARKQWALTRYDGVSDKDFWDGNWS